MKQYESLSALLGAAAVGRESSTSGGRSPREPGSLRLGALPEAAAAQNWQSSSSPAIPSRFADGGRIHRGRRDSKHFWMDDRSCKACFNCRAGFSLFRRKHHCRSCGAIFCDKCSSKTAPGRLYGYDGPVRVCDDCFVLSSQVMEGIDKQRSFFHPVERRSSDLSGKYALESQLDRGDDTLSVKSDDPSKERKQTPDEDFAEPPETRAAFEAQLRQAAEKAKRRAGVVALESFRSIPDFMDQYMPSDNEEEKTLNTRAVSTAVFQPRARGNSSDAILNTETDNVRPRLGEARSESVIRTGEAVGYFDDLSTRAFTEEPVTSLLDALEIESLPVALERQWKGLCHRMETAIRRLVNKEVNGLRNQRPSIILSDEVKHAWKKTIVSIVKEFTEHVRPERKYMDSALKLVTIPGGKVADSTVIHGVVCEKHVVDRRMKQRIENPRIMLLRGSMEFLRDKTRITSFQTLLEQEDRYMDVIVRKIKSIGVDLLIVGGSVCMTARSMLLAQGISVVVSCSDRLMDRISWLTGAITLPSTGNISRANDPCGTCALWSLQKFKIKLTEEQENEILQPLGSSSTIGTEFKTMMFFEGCPPQLGGTVVLRGGCVNTVNEMRDIVQKAISTSYLLQQQHAFFRDIGLFMPGDRLEVPQLVEADDAMLSLESLELLKVSVVDQKFTGGSKLVRMSLNGMKEVVSLGEYLRQVLFTSTAGSGNTQPPLSKASRARVGGGARSAHAMAAQPASGVGETSTGSATSSANLAFTRTGTGVNIMATSNAILQAATRIAQEEENTTKDLSTRENFTVFQIGDARVYVFSGVLSESHPVQGPLRNLLMRARREHVSKSIRRMLNSYDDEETDTLSLRQWSLPIREHPILTWSECSVCQATTMYRVLSKDAEALPFSRWLQLKFFFKGTNISSMPEDAPLPCRHWLFQSYVTYFECLGKVAGFELEACPRFSVNLPPKGPEALRQLSATAEHWLASHTKRKREELQSLVDTLEMRYLKGMLWSCRDHMDPAQYAALGLAALTKRVESGFVFIKEILVGKKNILQLNYIIREIVHLSQDWNASIQKIAENSTPDPKTNVEITRLRRRSLSDSDMAASAAAALAKVDLSRSASSSGNNHQFMWETLLQPVEVGHTISQRGHPSLPEGFGKRVVLVYDEEPTSWIAHTLISKPFRTYLFSQIEELEVLEEFHAEEWGAILQTPLDHQAASSSKTFSFHDSQPNGGPELKFTVKTYSALHFHALRQTSCRWSTRAGESLDPEVTFLESLSRCSTWAATGGKSQSHFFKCRDGRYIAKSISSEELDMFLGFAQSYFAYLGHTYADNQISTLLRIVGVYSVTLKRNSPSRLASYPSSEIPPLKLDASGAVEGASGATKTLPVAMMKAEPATPPTPPMEDFSEGLTSACAGPAVAQETVQGSSEDSVPQVEESAPSQPVVTRSISREETPQKTSPSSRTAHFVILENLFQDSNAEMAGKFDLKGNFRNRFVSNPKSGDVLLDRNFCSFLNGIPLPLLPASKASLMEALKRDTAFLESEEIVDYSLLLGVPMFDNNATADAKAAAEPHTPQLLLGLIDFLQLYNVKKMIESNVKRAGMIAGQLEPTVIDPSGYRSRMLRAMDNYFAAVPDQPTE